jgi:hypothetical protein
MEGFHEGLAEPSDYARNFLTTSVNKLHFMWPCVVNFFWNVTPRSLVDKYVHVSAFRKIMTFSEMLVLVRLILKFLTICTIG